jgi:hypothetical protein
MTAMKPPPFLPTTEQAQQLMSQHQQQQQQPNMVSPPFDGIGDLEFAGEFVSDESDYMNLPPQIQEAASSPAENSTMSEYERRMRSNSLFSALLNDPRASGATTTASHAHQQYGQWMEPHAVSSSSSGIQIGQASNNRRSSSGIAASLEAEQKKREKQERKELKKKERLERKERKEQEKRQAAAVEEEDQPYVPGSGRPRSLSDPNLRARLDDDGLVHVDRPEGWVGAYSPDSRKVRIERFLEKRNHRVWTKTVKYDVRKNFADSRLRVKGRFVKKEDEVLMRELISLT